MRTWLAAATLWLTACGGIVAEPYALAERVCAIAAECPQTSWGRSASAEPAFLKPGCADRLAPQLATLSAADLSAVQTVADRSDCRP